MPARMWHHGIPEFLEVGSRSPESMLAFIYTAYPKMALAGTESLRLEMSKSGINQRQLVRKPQLLIVFCR